MHVGYIDELAARVFFLIRALPFNRCWWWLPFSLTRATCLRSRGISLTSKGDSILANAGWAARSWTGSSWRSKARICEATSAMDDAPHHRTAIGFLDQLFGLLEDHHVRIVARVWIKGIGAAINGTSVYTASVQAIYRYFQNYVTGLNDRGIVIADGRSKTKNVNVCSFDLHPEVSARR